MKDYISNTESGIELKFVLDSGFLCVFHGLKEIAGFNIHIESEEFKLLIEDIRITDQRKGIYTHIIDTISFDNDFHNLIKGYALDEDEEMINTVTIVSQLRSEQACFFWDKRGYTNKYCKTEHENGEQDIIEESNEI